MDNASLQDVARGKITKNFRVGTSRFRNNELCTVTAIGKASQSVARGDQTPRGLFIWTRGLRSRASASQGKTVDQVIVSVPVAAFSQTNEAQFYVSMSRARHAMHLYTDSKAAIKEAVMRPSGRLSPLELLEGIKSERAPSLRCNTPAQQLKPTRRIGKTGPMCALNSIAPKTNACSSTGRWELSSSRRRDIAAGLLLPAAGTHTSGQPARKSYEKGQGEC
jgi:hypothetical protein